MRTVSTITVLLTLVLASSAMSQTICYECHFNWGDIYGKGFHANGVARCNACHTMHNSEDGTAVDPDSPSGNPWLLRDASASDTCLGCHAGFISNTLGTDPLNPPREIGAGNFVFLFEDNLNDGHNGDLHPIAGDAAGHNVNAPGYGLGSDGTLTASPGGSFPSGQLGCTSCHDPHGNMNYRLLYGAGADVQEGIYTFTQPAPIAEGLSIYHGNETNTKHNAYHSGMSGWCGNCHGEFHQQDTSLKHPSGKAIGTIVAGYYNSYNGTEDLTGGSSASAYLALVPFEDPITTRTSTQGPGASSEVSCITCHRAHASSSPNAGRWDFNVTRLDEDGVVSGSAPVANPYGTAGQRSLCNKCHLKDEGDALP